MFGLRGNKNTARDKAVKEISNNLMPQLGGYIRYNNLAVLLRTDAYAAGYILAKISSLIACQIQDNDLPSSEFNPVLGMIVANIFGQDDTSIAWQAMKSHVDRPTPNYLEGKGKGDLIVAYAAGNKDISCDPAYGRAIAAFRAIEVEIGESAGQTSDHWAAIAGLENLWFTEHMNQYQ